MALYQTDFHFTGQTQVYHGKVRDVYTLDRGLLVMVATDRLSAFDVVLPKPIPYKGQVLNQLASTMLGESKSLVPNWLIGTPDPNVTIGYPCEPIAVEMVIRGYLCGHAAREYALGKRKLCGVSLPEGMRESDAFPEPIITPSTKANEGHDEDISREEILSRGLVSEEDYVTMENYTRQLFRFGSQTAASRGLILADTKYEFGKLNGKVVLMDEIHTPDSSRYFYANTYLEYQQKSIPQRQLSKEFVRQWLIEHGFMGKENQPVPLMPDEFIESVTARYIELYETLTGKTFIPASQQDPIARVESAVENFLKNLR